MFEMDNVFGASFDDRQITGNALAEYRHGKIMIPLRGETGIAEHV